MNRCVLIGGFGLIVVCQIQTTFAGPKGDVTVRGVVPGTITVDGDFSDWPFDKYTKVSQQPTAPTARDAFETNASGDHIVYEADRVGFFNGTVPAELTKSGVSDFGVSTYFSHDGSYLYMLSVFIDSRPRGDRDATVHGDQGFRNDGLEIFFDAKNDSDDDAAELAFPLFDDEDPNLDDIQVTFALNDNFLPAGAPAGAVGVRQHMERAGTAELMGPIDPDSGAQIRNAPDPGGTSYRAFLEQAAEVLGTDAAGRVFDDLRAAGAPNPEIAANPNDDFSGYAIEAVIPFGILPDFQPDHKIGFDVFYRDFDDEADAGGASQSWIDWTQNETVQCTQDGFGLFCGFNWGELLFDEVPDDPLDCNGDGVTDAADLECILQGGGADALSELLAATGLIAGDLDGNGEVAFADFLVLSANFGTNVGSYTVGDIDGSGDVAFGDFLILSANFGTSAAAAAVVPEPSSLSLLGLVSLLFGLVRSRRG